MVANWALPRSTPNQVRSSGYGVDKVEYKRAEAQVHTLEQKEMEKATFKPDMEKYRTGKKLRKQVRACAQRVRAARVRCSCACVRACTVPARVSTASGVGES